MQFYRAEKKYYYQERMELSNWLIYLGVAVIVILISIIIAMALTPKKCPPCKQRKTRCIFKIPDQVKFKVNCDAPIPTECPKPEVPEEEEDEPGEEEKPVQGDSGGLIGSAKFNLDVPITTSKEFNIITVLGSGNDLKSGPRALPMLGKGSMGAIEGSGTQGMEGASFDDHSHDNGSGSKSAALTGNGEGKMSLQRQEGSRGNEINEDISKSFNQNTVNDDNEESVEQYKNRVSKENQSYYQEMKNTDENDRIRKIAERKKKEKIDRMEKIINRFDHLDQLDNMAQMERLNRLDRINLIKHQERMDRMDMMFKEIDEEVDLNQIKEDEDKQARETLNTVFDNIGENISKIVNQLD